MAKMKELNSEINQEMATLNDRVKTERARQRMKLQEMRRKRNIKGTGSANNQIEAPAATTETILRDLKDRRSKYKVGLKTHIEEQDHVYNSDAEWQMWEEIMDEITGRNYYHNVATGKTQWDM